MSVDDLLAASERAKRGRHTQNGQGGTGGPIRVAATSLGAVDLASHALFPDAFSVRLPRPLGWRGRVHAQHDPEQVGHHAQREDDRRERSGVRPEPQRKVEFLEILAAPDRMAVAPDGQDHEAKRECQEHQERHASLPPQLPELATAVLPPHAP